MNSRYLNKRFFDRTILSIVFLCCVNAAFSQNKSLLYEECLDRVTKNLEARLAITPADDQFAKDYKYYSDMLARCLNGEHVELSREQIQNKLWALEESLVNKGYSSPIFLNINEVVNLDTKEALRIMSSEERRNFLDCMCDTRTYAHYEDIILEQAKKINNEINSKSLTQHLKNRDVDGIIEWRDSFESNKESWNNFLNKHTNQYVQEGDIWVDKTEQLDNLRNDFLDTVKKTTDKLNEEKEFNNDALEHMIDFFSNDEKCKRCVEKVHNFLNGLKVKQTK